jgi:hypothetical protein
MEIDLHTGVREEASAHAPDVGLPAARTVNDFDGDDSSKSLRH